MTLFALKAFLMMLIPWYRADFPTRAFPSEFSYQEYCRGSKVGEQKITPSDEVYKQLRAFMFEERHGWKYDFVDYAPRTRFVSNNMIINCLPDGIVVNYKHPDGQFVQISKDLKRSCPSLDLRRTACTDP
jgi:hypothetical protein